jgi:hypothetical protein
MIDFAGYKINYAVREPAYSSIRNRPAITSFGGSPSRMSFPMRTGKAMIPPKIAIMDSFETVDSK